MLRAIISRIRAAAAPKPPKEPERPPGESAVQQRVQYQQARLVKCPHCPAKTEVTADGWDVAYKTSCAYFHDKLIKMGGSASHADLGRCPYMDPVRDAAVLKQLRRGE
jgi:hypothetical protein